MLSRDTPQGDGQREECSVHAERRLCGHTATRGTANVSDCASCAKQDLGKRRRQECPRRDHAMPYPAMIPLLSTQPVPIFGAVLSPYRPTASAPVMAEPTRAQDLESSMGAASENVLHHDPCYGLLLPRPIRLNPARFLAGFLCTQLPAFQAPKPPTDGHRSDGRGDKRKRPPGVNNTPWPASFNIHQLQLDGSWTLERLGCKLEKKRRPTTLNCPLQLRFAHRILP